MVILAEATLGTYIGDRRSNQRTISQVIRHSSE
jgi:hypothetical protein